MANQFSNLPPLCDYFEEYLKQNKNEWTKNHYNSVRAGLRRFENWQAIEKIKLEEITWSKLQGYIRFMALQGSSTRNCSKYVNYPKTAIRWGIDTKIMPQKLEDLYTSNKSINKWNQEITPESQEFFDYLRVVIKVNSVRAHEFAHRIFNTFLKEKNLTYKKLRREHLVEFVRYMGQKKMGQHTKSQTSTRLRCYLRWLHEQKYIKRHLDELFPTNLIPKAVIHLPRPLDPEIDQAYQKILLETDDIIYKGIHLLRRTGLRVAELMELEFNCIDEHSNGYCSLKVPAIKLGMERSVPLDPLTVKYIKEIQSRSLIHNNNEEPSYLVIGSNGKRPEYDKFCYANVEICSRLKTKKWINLHALRHTYATNLLNAGVSIFSLKEILGHKTIIMTLKYAKVSQVKIKDEYLLAIEKMQSGLIAPILRSSDKTTEDIFTELSNCIKKQSDDCIHATAKSQVKSILNRLAKIKCDVQKLRD